MKLPRFLSVSVAALAGLVAMAAVPAWSERLDAAFLLGLGRVPTEAERVAWQGRESATLAELLLLQREQLRGGAVERQATVERAFRDAFGRGPNAVELGALPADFTYATLLQELVARLAANPEEYRAVLDRVYPLVIGRAPFVEEYAYWKAYQPLPYVLLVGCVENWGRRNAPGLMVTSGLPVISVSSDRLVTRQVSPAVAAEARRVLGLPPLVEQSLALARGCNVIAPGAAEVVSVSGVHFLAVGGERSAAK